MAAFPNTAYVLGSQVLAREDTIIMDRASDGSARGRLNYAKEAYDVTLIHENLTEAEANTIEDFYETDPTRQVEVTWRAVTYNCRWMGKPRVEHFQGTSWRCISRLLGVRADGL